MRAPDLPPAVCIVGRKNSGKTTLVVALAAELGRRGRRVATIKHGHHAFETDQPGRDSWRHFHEGRAEATIMAGTGKIALVMRIDGEPDPERLIAELYAGRAYDIVLVEGWKHGRLARIEVFRRELHGTTLWETMDEEAAALTVAIVTDDAERVGALAPPCPVIPLDPADPLGGAHVARVADLVERLFGDGDAR
jgi:molybdopterin-guanine dinucleotide biosynthesis protein MobB